MHHTSFSSGRSNMSFQNITKITWKIKKLIFYNYSSCFGICLAISLSSVTTEFYSLHLLSHTELRMLRFCRDLATAGNSSCSSISSEQPRRHHFLFYHFLERRIDCLTSQQLEETNQIGDILSKVSHKHSFLLSNQKR